MANNFVNGAAQVLYQGKWKVIDRFGNTIQGNNNIPARSATEKSFFQKNIAAIIIGILVLLSFIISAMNSPYVDSEISETTVDDLLLDSAIVEEDPNAIIEIDSSAGPATVEESPY